MTWSQKLKHNVTDIARLQKQLGLSDSETKTTAGAMHAFPYVRYPLLPEAD